MRRLTVPGAVLATVAVLLACGSAPAAAAAKCDGVPKRGCLLPFPNDVGLTRADPTSRTGRRVAFTAAEMPANASGKHVDPTEWNRNDGFSPGQPILLRVPSIANHRAFDRAGLVPITDEARYEDPGQKLLLLDEQTGQRKLIWSEVDANAKSDAERLLLVHPGRNLTPGRRYVVVLRGLRAPRPKGLAATWSPALRRALRLAKVTTASVNEAWDFTVASDQDITGRLLAMRDDAFRQLGDTNLADGVIQGSPPAFHVTSVTDYTPDQSVDLLRKVTGTFQVPCYLQGQGCPLGSRLHYPSAKPDATPTQIPGNTLTATFTCNIPRAAQLVPSHLGLYGHGLLGDQTQIDEDNIQAMSAEQDFTFCATDWYGFSKSDVPTAISALQDFSRFPNLIDRQLEGVIAQLYLGRLMAHPQGLASDPAFAGLLDTSGPLSYDSNSQGAIFGGTLTALAPDWRRAVLGVATMDYSVLLQRSTDFSTYKLVLDPAYPDPTDQTELLSLVQMLWDRTDSDGWTQHMTTKPPPGSPSHTILMHVAVGDHQVANVMSDVEARSIGAAIRRPSVDPGRSPDKQPSYGIPAIAHFPYFGSAVVWWDGGPQTPLEPTTNTAPQTGADPHQFPRSTRAARQQKAAFLLGDGVLEVCGSAPCHTDNYG